MYSKVPGMTHLACLDATQTGISHLAELSKRALQMQQQCLHEVR